MNFFNWLIGKREQQQPQEINESASETAFNARMNSNPQLKDCFDNCPDVSEDFVGAIQCQEDCNNQFDYETVRNRNEAARKIQQFNQIRLQQQQIKQINENDKNLQNIIDSYPNVPEDVLINTLYDTYKNKYVIMYPQKYSLFDNNNNDINYKKLFLRVYLHKHPEFFKKFYQLGGNKSYSVRSKKGKQLLKNYIIHYLSNTN